MQLGKRLVLTTAILGTTANGQITEIIGGIQSIVSDVTSVGGDITSGAESIFTVIVSDTNFGRKFPLTARKCLDIGGWLFGHRRDFCGCGSREYHHQRCRVIGHEDHQLWWKCVHGADQRGRGHSFNCHERRGICGL